MPFSPNTVNDINPMGRRFWAWAEPDNGYNVDQLINNNSTPAGGPPAAPWTRLNCGPNEETFSFHPGGANFVFCDGSVHFLGENLDGGTFRAILGIEGGEVVPGDIFWRCCFSNRFGSLLSPRRRSQFKVLRSLDILGRVHHVTGKHGLPQRKSPIVRRHFAMG